jgi:hypothetical protein
MDGVNYFSAVVQKVTLLFGIGNDCRRDVETVFMPAMRAAGAPVPAL